MSQQKQLSNAIQASKKPNCTLPTDKSKIYSIRSQFQDAQLIKYNFLILENVSHNTDLAKYLFEILRTQAALSISISYTKSSTNHKAKKTQLWLEVFILFKSTTFDNQKSNFVPNKFQTLIKELITEQFIPNLKQFIIERLMWEICLNNDEDQFEISQVFRRRIIEPLNKSYSQLFLATPQ